LCLGAWLLFPVYPGWDFKNEIKEKKMTASQSNDQLFGSNQLTEYLVDAGQRTVLFWDAMRQRGNQYLEHMARETPHVLDYDYELIVV
jgi:hypothetical protein